MEAAAARAKQAGLLWLAGFREACSFHRVVVPCLRSRKLMIRMGQCFLLHGFILLGSLFMLNSVVIPILLWILPGNCEQIDLRYLCDHESVLGLYSFLRSILIQLFYILWFYPLYIFSFIVTIIWYSDIAKHGFDAVTRKRSHLGQSLSMTDIPDSKHTPDGGKPGGVERVVLGFGEHAYSLLLLTIFLIEVFVTKYIPYIGKGLNFLLLSWINSYYCFEYKWNLSELSLDKRLDFFESNWAFFAGFGSPCALAIFFFSPLVSCGVMGILFPLFVLTAAGTQEEEVTDSQKRLWGGEGLQRIRILYFADILSFELIGQQPLGGLVAQLVLKLMSKNSIHAVAVMILLIWGGSPFEVLFSPGCGYCNGFPRAVKVTDKVKHPWSRTYFPVNLVALSYAKEQEIDASSPCSTASGLGYL